MKKSAFIAIVGRPSAGKSTLLNRLTGQKVSIISPVPQTTRNKIRGIVNDPRGQLVFVDTPGFHQSERKFNIQMKSVIRSALQDVEEVLYVIDPTRPYGAEEREITAALGEYGGPVAAVFNKSDLFSDDPGKLQAQITAFGKTAREAGLKGDAFHGLFPVSAETGGGIDRLKDLLFQHAPEGEQVYPEEFYTDQPPEFRASEIIREKAILESRQELPHSIYVEIADMEADDEENKLWIRAFIWVERESQKGMLVGKGGGKIKTIRIGAQKELARIFPYRIHLDLRVKVNKKWRRNETILKKIFY
jgi:GTP-binding protein Era